jgi:glycosyltransferase involved in cell wall biosynthesis
MWQNGRKFLMSASASTICQITTVHPRYDVRIYKKICMSLVADYEVILIVADGRGDEVINNVTIIDVDKKRTSRIKRILFTTRAAYKKAIELDCMVYHFHDPEFLYYALKLSRKGKMVIYDVHEDVAKQTLSKDYINPVFRFIIAQLVKITENYISSKLYAVVTATPFINSRFQKFNKNCININNYPLIPNLSAVPFEQRHGLCYIGSISRIRGIREIIDSLDNIDVSLNLAGDYESEEFKKELINNKNWGKVKYYGSVSSEEVLKILKNSQVGLVTYLPEPNHIDAQPNKMFEYMAAALPIIASDFPLWKEIVEENNCGICVNPKDTTEIAKAISYLLINKDVAETMGGNGVKAVTEKFNWDSEKTKLLSLYSSLFQ